MTELGLKPRTLNTLRRMTALRADPLIYLPVAAKMKCHPLSEAVLRIKSKVTRSTFLTMKIISSTKTVTSSSYLQVMMRCHVHREESCS